MNPSREPVVCMVINTKCPSSFIVTKLKQFFFHPTSSSMSLLVRKQHVETMNT